MFRFDCPSPSYQPSFQATETFVFQSTTVDPCYLLLKIHPTADETAGTSLSGPSLHRPDKPPRFLCQQCEYCGKRTISCNPPACASAPALENRVDSHCNVISSENLCTNEGVIRAKRNGVSHFQLFPGKNQVNKWNTNTATVHETSCEKLFGFCLFFRNFLNCPWALQGPI